DCAFCMSTCKSGGRCLEAASFRGISGCGVWSRLGCMSGRGRIAASCARTCARYAPWAGTSIKSCLRVPMGTNTALYDVKPTGSGRTLTSSEMCWRSAGGAVGVRPAHIGFVWCSAMLCSWSRSMGLRSDVEQPTDGKEEDDAVGIETV
ncbi:unnamed protein product, partial [Mycena citricolor]